MIPIFVGASFLHVPTIYVPRFRSGILDAPLGWFSLLHYYHLGFTTFCHRIFSHCVLLLPSPMDSTYTAMPIVYVPFPRSRWDLVSPLQFLVHLGPLAVRSGYTFHTSPLHCVLYLPAVAAPPPGSVPRFGISWGPCRFCVPLRFTGSRSLVSSYLPFLHTQFTTLFLDPAFHTDFCLTGHTSSHTRIPGVHTPHTHGLPGFGSLHTHTTLVYVYVHYSLSFCSVYVQFLIDLFDPHSFSVVDSFVRCHLVMSIDLVRSYLFDLSQNDETPFVVRC